MYFNINCLSVIYTDSVFRTGNNYFPQEYLGECKYVVKQKNDDIEISSDSDRENSDKGNSDKENSYEENLKNIHIVKLIFKSYQKSDKIFFYNFFCTYKNVKRILPNKQRKAFKKGS